MKRFTTTMERWMLFFGQRYPINFSYYFKLKGVVNKDALLQAVNSVKGKHTLPFTRLVDEEGGLKALSTENVAEPTIVDLPEQITDWTELVKMIISEPFDNDNGPFFRLGLRTVDGISEVIFIFQHSVADGVGATMFCQDVFNALAGKFSWNGTETRLPDLYEMIKDDIYQELESRPRDPFERGELGEKVEFEVLKPDFRIYPFSMTAEQLEKFRLYGKNDGLTVHSLLGAILLKTSAEIFGKDSSYTRTIQCPVDHRANLKKEALEQVGVFNGIIKAEVDCSLDRSYLEIGHDIQDKIKEARADYKDLERQFNFKQFGTVPNSEEFMETVKQENIQDYDFSFSNVGRLSWEEKYGELELLEVFGPTFSSVCGELVFGVNSSLGKLNITMIYDPEAYFDDSKGKLFAKKIQEKLDSFLMSIE